MSASCTGWLESSVWASLRTLIFCEEESQAESDTAAAQKITREKTVFRKLLTLNYDLESTSNARRLMQVRF